MDLDFIGNLLKGQGGSNALTTLIPLLLGSKTPDLSSLFSSSKNSVKSDNDSFPPLFGDNAAQNSGANGMFDLLKGLIPNVPSRKEAPIASEQYPYELQYNRPNISDMHKK